MDIIKIQNLANKAVYENILTHCSYPEEEVLKNLDYRSKKELLGKIRIVSIKDIDVCACCGTHVKNTGEIGIIKLSPPTKYKGGVRLTILCGKKALEDYEEKDSQNREISQMLSLKPNLVSVGVSKKISECEDLKRKLKEAQNSLFSLMAQEYKDQSEPLFLFNEELSSAEIKEFASHIVKVRTGTVLILSKSENSEYRFVLASQKEDLREKSKEFLKKANGKGGGSPTLLQGTVDNEITVIKASFNSVFCESEN